MGRERTVGAHDIQLCMQDAEILPKGLKIELKMFNYQIL